MNDSLTTFGHVFRPSSPAGELLAVELCATLRLWWCAGRPVPFRLRYAGGGTRLAPVSPGGAGEEPVDA